ncbi:MAG: collagenase [Pseudomonadota bacterium]
MSFHRSTALCAGILAACISPMSQASPDAAGKAENHARLKAAPMPRAHDKLPPSREQSKFNLPPSKHPRQDLQPKSAKTSALAATALTTTDCKNMDKLASYSGAALADYIVNLPDYECHYGLFSLTPAQAATVYSASNFSAVATRFAQEAASYNASNIKLINLIIYLRAGYYLASDGTVSPAPSLLDTLRPPLKNLVDGSALYASNTAASSTAGEAMRLITNMHDEASFLPNVKKLIVRMTNTPTTPQAAEVLKQDSAAGALTGALTVVFYAHYRPEGLALLQNDPSYPTALNNFVVNNKAALLGSNASYELNDTANEAFRFMQYAGLKSTVKPMVKNTLATSTMTGADNDLWLAAASAVNFYDAANCADYGTCNFKTDLANAVLKYSYTCSPTVRIRAQDMTVAQLQDSCAILQTEEGYFHDMMQTKRTPVANDHNGALELVVFDDYSNYSKYASVIYDMSTDNGGMYLEGDPSSLSNQARFVAHEASWLRPTFQVWNLQHEYVHYLDGRFDMIGDFNAETAKPSVWWIEGIAEYLSLKNNDQAAIDAAKTGSYKLSEVFGNTYAMSDYVNRAYRWGYMATRFMMENHRNDVDTVIGKFRVGDYDGYQNYMAYIGTRYDAEFATWAAKATTAGEPPLPTDPVLPNCPAGGNMQLGKNCSIKALTSGSQAYAYILLPAGAKNLKLSTSGGTGNVDLYLALDRYPSASSYDAASTGSSNRDSVSVASPVAGHWYYIVLKAQQAFNGVTLAATYD